MYLIKIWEAFFLIIRVINSYEYLLYLGPPVIIVHSTNVSYFSRTSAKMKFKF